MSGQVSTLQSASPSTVPLISPDIQASQRVLADGGTDKDVVEDVAARAAVDMASDMAVDAGGDEEVDELFADGVHDDGDDNGPPLTPHTSEDSNWPAVINNSGPSVLALRERVPYIRAQLVGFLDELDSFARQIPSSRQK